MTREEMYDWCCADTDTKIVIDTIYDDIESRVCSNCYWYQDEVCAGDSSPLQADFVDKDYGCILFKIKDK